MGRGIFSGHTEVILDPCNYLKYWIILEILGLF